MVAVIDEQQMLAECIAMALNNVDPGQGGPFAAIITRGGHVIGKGVNRVTPEHDPTAHAEMVAIRDACLNTGEFSLEGATIYSSCEPCPMCMAAIYWARISRVVYAAGRSDAARAGFDDALIAEELFKPQEERNMPISQLKIDSYDAPFLKWCSFTGKTEY